MASHSTTFKRISAITKLASSTPGLLIVPENSQTFEDWISDVCAEYFVSRRTAIEYLRTAKAKLRIKVKAENDEITRLQEEVKVLKASVEADDILNAEVVEDGKSEN